MRKTVLILVILVPILACLCLVGLYFVPPIHDRLAWRLDELGLQVAYKLNPPAKAVFVPTQQGETLPTVTPQLAATLEASAPQATEPVTAQNTAQADITATPSGPTDTPAPTLPPTAVPTPLPGSVALKGVRYQNQAGRFNYCAPANLAMALSYWGWKGDRDVVGPVIKPDSKDKNVMPYEMADYVSEHTDLHVVVRVGGDLELIKRFLAAGFPVLVEKGTYLRDLQGVVSWMGHYEVITGYDDAKLSFVAQDSYTGPDFPVPYGVMTTDWRSFNYTYLIIFPADKEADVMALLGPDADETANFQRAAQKATDEMQTLSGIDLFFAMYNRGTNLVQLQDYAGAAAIYDQAFLLYPSLSEKDRPWRILWYETGPYFAYYYTGRYDDVIRRADITLGEMKSEKNLEESYYWRGMAELALGNKDDAIKDFKEALKWHPGWAVATEQLTALGVEP